MNVNIVFANKLQPDIAKAIVAERICQAASLYIDLPDNINIEFADLGHNGYGEATLRFGFSNNIRLNSTLDVKELIYPLVHELVHINQIYKGKLTVNRFNDCVYNGKTYKIDYSKLSYQEYKMLPWEQDAYHRQKQLLVKILKIKC